MYSKSVLALAALLSAALWFGCDDEDDCVDCHWPGIDLSSLQIVTEVVNDTLKYFAQDSSAIRVIVIATGYDGLVMPGLKIDIRLSAPQLGVIEFTDPEWRDTTDQTGRVNMLFHSYATAGSQIITASAGGRTASRTLTMIEIPRPEEGAFILHSDRPHDTVYVAPDSVLAIHLSAAFIDGDGNPRPEFDGMLISSSATGGTLERFSVFANGQSSSTWTFHNVFGSFQARIFGNLLEPITILPDTTG